MLAAENKGLIRSRIFNVHSVASTIYDHAVPGCAFDEVTLQTAYGQLASLHATNLTSIAKNPQAVKIRLELINAAPFEAFEEATASYRR